MEKIILRWSIDDGRKNCIRAADLLHKYDFKGIFYIAPYERKCIMTIRDIIDIAKYHEIGGHTLFHTILTRTDPEMARKEIFDSKHEFEEIIGKKIKKFAYPRGYTNPELMAMVEKAGWKEARTMILSSIDIKNESRFALPISFHFYPRPEYEALGIEESFKKRMDEAIAGGNYFNSVAHTDELDRYNLWGVYENCIRYAVKNRNSFIN